LALRQFLHNLAQVGSISLEFSPGLNTPGEGNKFVYTCKQGWIDLGHYSIAATGAYLGGERSAIIGGYALELSQWIPLILGYDLGDWTGSAFTTEDLFSNALGAKAGQDMRSKTVAFWTPEQQKALEESAGSTLGGIKALLTLQDYPFPERILSDLNSLNPVNPDNELPDGTFARKWLEKGARWTGTSEARQFFGRGRKMPWHSCVCDKDNNPIGRQP
jgi:hypothetical protein